jgi:pilus assembly protein CpaC
MIIVTPIIVRATKPGDIARPDDNFAESSDPQAWLLGRMNRLYATPNNPETVKNYRGHVGFIQD